VVVDVNRITNVSATHAHLTGWWWRYRAIMKLRTDPRVATPQWAATELLYRLTNQHDDWADTIVVTIVGGLMDGPLAEASSPGRGRRIVRLHYHWETEIEPWLHLPPRALSDTRLTELAGFGWLLRARVRAAARR
jgi:hypothetical protein